MSFFEAAASGGQIGGVDERRGVLPQRGGLDQRLEEGLIDLPQPQHAHTGTKRVEDANVRYAMAIAQPGEIPPRALLGQQLRQQVE